METTLADLWSTKISPDIHSVAAGVAFLNLEDETGILNVACSTGLWTKYRRVARNSAGLLICGIIERSDGAADLIADRIEPLQQALHAAGAGPNMTAAVPSGHISCGLPLTPRLVCVNKRTLRRRLSRSACACTWCGCQRAVRTIHSRAWSLGDQSRPRHSRGRRGEREAVPWMTPQAAEMG